MSKDPARRPDAAAASQLLMDAAIHSGGVTSAAARPAAELMAGELGWDGARVDDEVDHYLRRVEAERRSQLAPTDQEADEARVQAKDIV